MANYNLTFITTITAIPCGIAVMVVYNGTIFRRRPAVNRHVGANAQCLSPCGNMLLPYVPQ